MYILSPKILVELEIVDNRDAKWRDTGSQQQV